MSVSETQHHDFGATAFRDKDLSRLGFLVMAALLILSAVFYKERCLFIDIAYQTFLMIKEGTVQVQVFRFGSAVVQALPLIAIKAGLALKVVLISYSISFTLFYLLIYILIVKWLKNEYLGWALVFLFTLIVYDGFYWATSEYQQGLAFLLLVFAFIYRFPALDRPVYVLFLGPAVLALVYYHPLVFIIFVYLWGYFRLHDKRFRHWRYAALAGLAPAMVFLKSKVSSNWYDDHKQQVFLNNLVEHFPNYFVFKSHFKFLANCLEYWYFFPVFLLVMTGFYLVHRHWARLFWMVGFSFAYIMLLHIGSPDASYRFYAEVNYMPLALVVMVPFLFDVVPTIPQPRLVFYLFLVVVLVRLFTIGFHHQTFTDRLQWIRKNIDLPQKDATASKWLVKKEKIPMDTLIISWGLAYESLLLSALDHPDSAATLVALPEGETLIRAKREPGLFISEINSYPVREINSVYYRLSEEPYREITTYSDDSE